MSLSRPEPARPTAHRRQPVVRAHLRSLIRSSGLGLTAIALLVGVGAGLVVLAMSRVVQWAHVLLFGIDLNERLSGVAHIETLRLLTWPVAGGLVVGLSLWARLKLGLKPAVDPIEANALRGGRMSVRDSLVVVFQTLVSNGCGASVGLEAGYTQAGSGLASALGGWLGLRRNDMRILVGCGAAGAIAAAFGAPLTGAFYGFEVVIGAYSIASAAPVMAAAIAGGLVAQQLGGALYHIDVHTHAQVKSLDYVFFAALGAICAMLGVVLMRGVSVIERLFQRPWLPLPCRPMLGGLGLGLMALITPQVLSAGHGALAFDLSASESLRLILMLLALKMAASAVSLGSGFRGGLFFASLLLGVLAGQAFARLIDISGAVSLDPTTAALVGMGAFAVAIVGGPMTMSFLVLETTGDYGLTGAVLGASVLSGLIVRETFGYSFSTFRLHLRGESIRGAFDVGRIRQLTVGRLMRGDPRTIAASATLEELRQRFPLGSTQEVVLLDDRRRYAGMVSVVEAHAVADPAQRSLADLARFADLTLTPAMNVAEAMKLFDRAEAEVLAVVDGPDSGQVLGLLKESFAARRYAEELDRSRRDLVGDSGPAVSPD